MGGDGGLPESADNLCAGFGGYNSGYNIGCFG